MLVSGMHQSAPLWQRHTTGAEAPAQLLAFVQALKPSGLPTALVRVGTSVAKISVACAPHLFDDLKPPLWPRTTHALDLCMGRIKQSRRHLPGRKTTPALMLRDGRLVAMRVGRPHPHTWGDACSKGKRNDFHDPLTLLRQTDTRRQGWPTRRDFGAYLSAWEQPWVPHA